MSRWRGRASAAYRFERQVRADLRERRWLLSRHGADGGDLGSLYVPGGSGGSFDAGGDTGSALAELAGQGASKVLGAAVEVGGSADEGAIVMVPLALLVGVAMLMAAAFGVAVFGLFGVEVLLGVAVEIAIASAGGALAYKARREGWLGHATRRSIVPLLIVLAATVGTGLLLAHWLPEAATLPQAIRLLLG